MHISFFTPLEPTPLAGKEEDEKWKNADIKADVDHLEDGNFIGSFRHSKLSWLGRLTVPTSALLVIPRHYA
jgi:hypothetical protein